MRTTEEEEGKNNCDDDNTTTTTTNNNNNNANTSNHGTHTNDNSNTIDDADDNDTAIDTAIDNDNNARRNVPTTTSPNTNTRSAVVRWNCLEVLVCLLPAVLGVSLEFASPWFLYERPIPYQTLEIPIATTAETETESYYLRNQMYDVHQHGGETVPPAAMFLIGIVIPFVVQLLVVLYRQYYPPHDTNNTKKNQHIHKTLCVYLLAIGLTQSLTNIAKLYVGYLRPIFYEVCQLTTTTTSDPVSCATTTKHEHSARVSFPSGHASMSTCGLLLLSYYLARIFGRHRRDGGGARTTRRRRRCSNSYSIQNDDDDNDEDDDENENYSSHRNIRATSATEMATTPRRCLPIQLARLVSIMCYAPMLVAFFISAFYLYTYIYMNAFFCDIVVSYFAIQYMSF